jgi:hypothetical protein
MNPSRRNLFMKKFTRERVVPIISARVSCESRGTVLTVVSSLPYRASSSNVRASRFSLELKSWSTRSSSTRMLRESMWVINRSEKSCCSCSVRIISAFGKHNVVVAVIAVAVRWVALRKHRNAP